jgi:long-chain acyl-CoA synthetase
LESIANVYLFSLSLYTHTGPDVEQYLHYVSGAAGMLAMAGVGVAAASAYYLANRPIPTTPPFDLDNQTIVEV